MRTRIGWLLTAMMGAGPAAAQPSAVDRYVGDAMEAWGVPGVAIVVVRGDSAMIRGFGVRSLGDRRPVGAGTVFGIGSLTKAFTTTALAMLVDSGAARWDDPVGRHLPAFRLSDPLATARVTLRDLAAHRTGMAGADFVWYAAGFDRAELVRRIQFLRPAAGFRERLSYNNLMYVALGEVIGVASGASWDRFVRRRLLDPLGMVRTGTSTATLPTDGDVAAPHARIGATVVGIPRRRVDNLGAAGALNTSAADLSRWLRFQLSGGTVDGRRLVSSKALAETWAAHVAVPIESPREGDGGPRDGHLGGYGLGWFLRDDRGRLVVEHGGNIDGMSAAVAMIPELGVAVGVLANLHGSALPDLLARWFLDRERGLEPRDWSGEALVRARRRSAAATAEAGREAGRLVGTRPSVPLDRFEGVYRDSVYGDLVVRREGDTLVAELGQGLRGVLEHWHHDTFRAHWAPAMWGRAWFGFRLDWRGQIDGVEVAIGGEPQPVWFGRAAGVPAPPSLAELITAMSAKIVCSGVFLTGREPEEILRNSAARFFGRFERRRITATEVDRDASSVSLTLDGRFTRTARLAGDQGCVILPRDGGGLRFTPVPVRTALPPPATVPWPMGDAEPAESASQRINRRRLDQGLDLAFSPAEALTLAVVVVHRGRIVAERYAPGIGRDTQLESWSMGKSITATLIGRLIQQGRLRLDQPAPIDEWQAPGDRRAAIRIGDLMQMSSGLRFSGSEDPPTSWLAAHPDHLYVYSGAIDAFRFSVDQPAEFAPQTVGRYRNADALALGAIIKRTVVGGGEEYLTWPQRELFDRIGIRRQVLETDPWGNFLLTGYDYGTARNWARLGLLWLRDGFWNGEQLLPKGFSTFASSPAPAWSRPEYGALFRLNGTGEWRLPREAYFMSGGGVSKTVIVPSHDLVIVRMGHLQGTGLYERTLNLAFAEILGAIPKVESGPNAR